MKALIVIEIDENHLLKEMNELYDRLNGYKCELIPMPQKKELKGGWYHPADVWIEGANFGWNACLDALGETE